MPQPFPHGKLPRIGGEIAQEAAEISDASTAVAWLLRHRLIGLAAALRFTALTDDAKAELHQKIRHLRAATALRRAVMEQDLNQAMRALHAAGVQPVVLKGAAIAARIYDEPEQRPSIDIDLFVAPEDLERIHATMQALNWTQPQGQRGQWVSGQFSYSSPRSPSLATTIDLHWRLTNRPSLNHVLRYPQVYAQGVDNLDSFPYARSISPAHALVHAIVHLVGHHGREEIPALWWVDIAALDASLTAEERRMALTILARANLTPLAHYVWREAAFHIGFQPSEDTRHLLTPSARSLDWQLAPSSRLQEVLADLRALPGPQRVHYLQELAFPAPASIRAAYGEQHAQTPVWQLYLRRFLDRGVRSKKGE